MARMTEREPLTVDSLLRELGALAGRRSELLAAEARLWTDANRLLTSAAEFMSCQTVQSPSPVAKRANDGNELLSTGQTAEFLNLAPPTLAKWRLQGGGPTFVRLGGRIFYRRSTLEQFLSEKTFPHTSAYREK